MIQQRRHLLWMFLILAVFAIIFLRAPEVLLLPSLQVEDGSQVFAHFYQHRGPEQILRFKGGYLPLIANIIGYCSIRLPTRLIPYGLTWIPLIITLATYCLFFATRYRQWLSSDQSRAVTCILFALAPVTQFHLLAHTDYSIWNTFLLLILLSVCRLPKRPWLKYPYWILCNLLIWSHPLTVLIFPLAAYFMFKDKCDRGLYAVILLNLIAHQAFGVESQVFSGLSAAGQAIKLGRTGIWTFVIIGETAFRTAFGALLFAWTAEHMWLLLVGWTAFLAVSTTVVFRKAPQSRIPIVFILYLIFGTTFLNVLSRGYEVAGDLNYSPRYIYIQSVSFLVLFVILVTCLTESRPDLATPLKTRNSHSLASNNHYLFLMLLLLAHYFLLNTQFGHYFVTNTKLTGPYHYSDPENGRIVRDFFAELAQMEKRNGSYVGIYLVAEKKNDNPIVIDTRAEAVQSLPH